MTDTILVVAEYHQQALHSATYHAITAAQQLASEVHLLLIGHQLETLTESAKKIAGVSKVIVVDNAVYAAQLAENVSQVIAKVAKNYLYLLAASSTFGKDVLPRAAAYLDMPMISDVLKIIDKETFVRPIYAGNVLATVKSTAKIKVLTIRTTAFSLAKATNTTACEVEKLNEIIPATATTFVNLQKTVSKRPELANAKVIISGGRGLKSAENFHLLEEIADCLGGAVGASRAAVDAGFAPNDYQIGQTGKIVAPDLYIAVGISGAIQHLAGMQESKVIVAINNDPDAPIFSCANYGLVGDLFKLLPELKAELQKVKA